MGSSCSENYRKKSKTHSKEQEFIGERKLVNSQMSELKKLGDVYTISWQLADRSGNDKHAQSELMREIASEKLEKYQYSNDLESLHYGCVVIVSVKSDEIQLED